MTIDFFKKKYTKSTNWILLLLLEVLLEKINIHDSDLWGGLWPRIPEIPCVCFSVGKIHSIRSKEPVTIMIGAFVATSATETIPKIISFKTKTKVWGSRPTHIAVE
jgi:hypothetical protein